MAILPPARRDQGTGLFEDSSPRTGLGAPVEKPARFRERDSFRMRRDRRGGRSLRIEPGVTLWLFAGRIRKSSNRYVRRAAIHRGQRISRTGGPEENP